MTNHLPNGDVLSASLSCVFRKEQKHSIASPRHFWERPVSDLAARTWQTCHFFTRCFCLSLGNFGPTQNKDPAPRLRHDAANEIRSLRSARFDPPLWQHQTFAVDDNGLLVHPGGFGTEVWLSS